MSRPPEKSKLRCSRNLQAPPMLNATSERPPRSIGELPNSSTPSSSRSLMLRLLAMKNRHFTPIKTSPAPAAVPFHRLKSQVTRDTASEFRRVNCERCSGLEIGTEESFGIQRHVIDASLNSRKRDRLL